MRKLLLIGFIVLGALIGLLSAANDGSATRIVMVGIGALFGVAIGGAIAGFGRAKGALKWERDAIPGMGVTSDDLVANYWRDRGHPPFMKPPDAEAESRIAEPGPLR